MDKPKATTDKSEAMKKLFALLERVWERTKDIPEEEIVEEVLEAIREVRQAKRREEEHVKRD